MKDRFGLVSEEFPANRSLVPEKELSSKFSMCFVEPFNQITWRNLQRVKWKEMTESFDYLIRQAFIDQINSSD